MSQRHLLLIRHGRSALAWPPGLLALNEIESWRDAYDATAIAPGDEPPRALVAEVAKAWVVAASDLPRAVASAARLAPGREVRSEPLFREFSLTIPRWSACPLPFAAWALAVHIVWGLDILRGRDAPPHAVARAAAAASWCRETCLGSPAGGGTVVVVTHGVFRRLLANQLIAEGWRPSPGRRSYAHWSVWRFDPPAG